MAATAFRRGSERPSRSNSTAKPATGALRLVDGSAAPLLAWGPSPDPERLWATAAGPTPGAPRVAAALRGAARRRRTESEEEEVIAMRHQGLHPKQSKGAL